MTTTRKRKAASLSSNLKARKVSRQSHPETPVQRSRQGHQELPVQRLPASHPGLPVQSLPSTLRKVRKLKERWRKFFRETSKTWQKHGKQTFDPPTSRCTGAALVLRRRSRSS